MTQESRLVIVIDSSQARPSAENLARAMRALDEAGVRVSHTTQDVGEQMQRMAGQSNAAAAALRRGLIAALGSISTMKIIDIADEWGQYASRIRMATESAEEYEIVQARMLQSANATYRNINETREAFIQLSPVIRSMGASLEQSLDVVDAFSGLMVINSADTERAAAAMRAFSVSLQKGRIDQQNWMTMYSALDSMVDEIAAHTGKSADEIRKLGAAGKLSIEMLVAALAGRLEPIMKKVAEMPTTVKDALGNVSNAFGEYIGTYNEANQVTATLAAGIGVLGENLETVLNYALVAGAGALGRYAAGMTVAAAQTAYKGVQSGRARVQELALAKAQEAQTAATLAQVRALATLTPAHAQVAAATIAHEKATQRLAAAQVAARGAGISLLGVLGGPVGFAVMAGLAATAFLDMGNSAKTAALNMDELKGSIEKASEAFAKMGVLSRQAALDKLAEQHAKEAEKATVAWNKFVNKLEPTTAKGSRGVANMRVAMRNELKAIASDTRLTTNEMEQAVSDLMDKWVAAGTITAEQADSYRKVASEAASLQNTMNQTGQRIEELSAKNRELNEAARSAAAGVGTLNAAMAQTNDAAKSYMERLSERAMMAGLATERAKLTALRKAGKLVIGETDEEKKAWENALADADKIDRANAAGRTKKDPGADALKSLRERIALLGKQTEHEQTLARIQFGTLDAGKHKDDILKEAQKLDALQRQVETERVLKELRENQATTQMQYMRELEAFGQGENLRALNADLAKVEDQYRRLIEARRNSVHGLSDTELAQIQAALQEELELVRWFHDEKHKIEQDGTLGAINALRDYTEESKNLYKQMENAVSNAFKGMEDALLDFVTKGKLDFKSLADSIIRDMIRIAIQQSVTGPLAGMLGSFIGGLGGAASSGAGYTLGGGLSSAAGLSSGGYTGDGGKYEPAGIVHRGEGVLNQDEICALGGESGFNALRRAIRGPGHAVGGMAGRPALPPAGLSARAGDVNVTVNVSGNGAPQTEAPSDWQQAAKDIGRMVDAKVQEHLMRAKRPGGMFWQSNPRSYA